MSPPSKDPKTSSCSSTILAEAFVRLNMLLSALRFSAPMPNLRLAICRTSTLILHHGRPSINNKIMSIYESGSHQVFNCIRNVSQYTCFVGRMKSGVLFTHVPFHSFGIPFLAVMSDPDSAWQTVLT